MRLSSERHAAPQTAGMDFATSLSETSQLGMEMHVFNVQPQATERIVDLIDKNEATTQRLTFLRGLVPAVYTGMAYLALVGALAAVAAIDSANLTSVGAVMLIMLRSLSYGQALQSSITSINATLAVPRLARRRTRSIPRGAGRRPRSSHRLDRRSPSRRCLVRVHQLTHRCCVT